MLRTTLTILNLQELKVHYGGKQEDRRREDKLTTRQALHSNAGRSVACNTTVSFVQAKLDILYKM
jgi:hypothetical protein